MCEPGTLAIASLAMGALGAVQQSNAQKAAAKSAANEARYNAQVARNNQIIQEQNAEAALDQGRAEAEDKRRETAQRLGLQRAQLAAQGFDVGAGTSLDILGDTAALGELDVLRIESDAENRARNFRVQGSNFGAEAGLQDMSARNSLTAGALNSRSTLISGATGTLSSAAKFSEAGVWS